MTDSTFPQLYSRSPDDPSGFWGEIAEGIEWYEPWDTVLDADAAPAARWFTGGMLNNSYSPLDRHVMRLIPTLTGPSTGSKRGKVRGAMSSSDHRDLGSVVRSAAARPELQW